MTYDEYKAFFLWSVKTAGSVIQKKLGLFRMVSFDSCTPRHMTISVGPLFSCRTEDDEKLKAAREAAGCELKPGFAGRSSRSYSLAYSQASQKQLIKEIKQLFPAARIRSFTSVGENELRAKVNIPHADIIAFGQKEQLEGSFSAEDITQYLSGIETAIEAAIHNAFTLDVPHISFSDCYASIQLHFSEVEAEHFQNPDVPQPKLLTSDGYYAQIPYCDHNKAWVEKKLQETFPESSIDGFWSSGEETGMVDGKATTEKTLCVDFCCPFDKIKNNAERN